MMKNIKSQLLFQSIIFQTVSLIIWDNQISSLFLKQTEVKIISKVEVWSNLKTSTID